MKVVGGQCRGDNSGRVLEPSGCNCPLGEASFPWGWWVRGGPLVLSLSRTQAPALTEFTLKSYSPGAAPQPLQAAFISCSPHLYSSLPCPCRGVCVCVCVCVCACARALRFGVGPYPISMGTTRQFGSLWFILKPKTSSKWLDL